MTEPREFCETCQRWLEHVQRLCPLFPDVKPGNSDGYGPGRPLKKWNICVCLIHTCYQAPERDRDTAPTYSDFVDPDEKEAAESNCRCIQSMQGCPVHDRTAR